MLNGKKWINATPTAETVDLQERHTSICRKAYVYDIETKIKYKILGRYPAGKRAQMKQREADETWKKMAQDRVQWWPLAFTIIGKTALFETRRSLKDSAGFVLH
jgi:hypothetical protein